MQYTTVDNVARKLRGRLRIEDSPSVDTALGISLGYQNPLAGWVVDNDLIEQVADQEESMMDLYLYQVYELPLRLTHPITQRVLSDITEGFICAALIKVHFQGSSPIVPTSDISSIGVDFYRRAMMQMAAITASHQLYMSAMPDVQKNLKMVPQLQPLVLPEEIVKTRLPDTVTRNYTQLAKRTSTNNDYRDYFTEDTYNPRPLVPPVGRALGQEPSPCINPHDMD